MAAILLVGGGGYLAVCFLLAKTYLSPSRTHPATPPGIVDRRLQTAVGPVPAWLTPGLASGRVGRPVFVLAHGYGGDRRSWSELMPALAARGFECVAPTMPAHDASPDKTCGFGAKEARVVVAVAAWVREQAPDKPPRIVLVGISMGGAAVWLASEIDPSVSAVVSEGAYARFDEAMDGWLGHVFAGASVVLRPMVWMACSMSGLDPKSIRPMDAASKWRGKPALVIQGSEDRLIPFSHARRLATGSSPSRWWASGEINGENSRSRSTIRT